MIKKRLIQSVTYQKIRRSYDKYERYIIPSVLILGFFVDIFTFNTINLNTALLLLGGYLSITILTMACITIHDHKQSPQKTLIAKYLRIVASIIMQFSIGALLSAALIFYSFGSAFSISWPIIIFVGVLIIVNERHKYLFQNITIQTGLLFLLTLIYSSLVFPVLLQSIATWVFFTAGIVALAVMVGYYYAVKVFFSEIQKKKRSIQGIILLVYLAINTAYLINIIPPVPLAIREAGMYHDIIRNAQRYVLTQEKYTFWQKIIPGETLHIQPGEAIYAYTAIFAPTEVVTQVIHEWQYKNPQTNKWEVRGTLPFTLNGGRKEGFRGYSLKTQTAPGKWRVFTKLPNGQILGKMSFSVQYTQGNIATQIIEK